MLTREVIALKIDLAKDTSHFSTILSNHRSQSKDFVVYNLLLSASDAMMDMSGRAKGMWQEQMKDKLVNLFLDVSRVTVITLADKLIHDVFYSKLLTDVLFGYLKAMRKQVWVKTP